MSNRPDIAGYAPQKIATSGNRTWTRSAQVGLGLLSLAGLVCLMIVRPHASSRPGIESVSAIACTLSWWSGAYLLATAVAALTRGRANWRGRSRVGTVLPHMIVAVAALVSLLRSYRSIALLAGLDQLLSVTLAISLVGAAVTALESSGGSAAEWAGKTSKFRAAAILVQAVAAIGIAVTLAYVESSPPPAGVHAPMRQGANAG